MVVRSDGGQPRLSMLSWDSIPVWAKHPHTGHKFINAPVKTAAVQPSFRADYSKRRCFFPTD